MIVECVNVVFTNDAIFKSSGYDDFIVQINKVMETVWKSILNFTYTWQLTFRVLFWSESKSHLGYNFYFLCWF